MVPACTSSSQRTTLAPAYPTYSTTAPGYPATQYPAPAQPPLGAPPQGGSYPQSSQYPQQQYPQPQYSAPPPAMAPIPVAAPLPSVQSDPINDVNLGWLRQDAQSVMSELVQSLSDDARARVQGIPLVVDDTPGEVNAFAACSQSGQPAMAITDGLLEIAAWLAMSTAHDEIYGSAKTDEYIQFIATHLQTGKPIPRPAGFFTSAAQADGRKVQRQHVVFDEELGFILGHELSHHHLGHLPCTGKPGPLGSADIWRDATSRVAVFNQPNEAAADLAGTTNVLDAGKRRSGAHWTENGGLLTMRFFLGLEGEGSFNLLVAFQRSHPSPRLRIPLIEESANFWRQSGGIGIPVPRLGG
jgi:hypothetical protein